MDIYFGTKPESNESEDREKNVEANDRNLAVVRGNQDPLYVRAQMGGRLAWLDVSPINNNPNYIGAKIKPYICTYEGCGYTFWSKLNMTNHMKARHVAPWINCATCESDFVHKRLLKFHR